MQRFITMVEILESNSLLPNNKEAAPKYDASTLAFHNRAGSLESLALNQSGMMPRNIITTQLLSYEAERKIIAQANDAIRGGRLLMLSVPVSVAIPESNRFAEENNSSHRACRLSYSD